MSIDPKVVAVAAKPGTAAAAGSFKAKWVLLNFTNSKKCLNIYPN